MAPSGGKRSGPWHAVPQKTVSARPCPSMGVTDPLAPLPPHDLLGLTEIRRATGSNLLVARDRGVPVHHICIPTSDSPTTHSAAPSEKVHGLETRCKN